MGRFRAIDNPIVRLRGSIEDRRGASKFLQTVRGVDCRFVPPPEWPIYYVTTEPPRGHVSHSLSDRKP